MCFSALSSINVGAYLVLLAWCAVAQTGDARLVSTIFMLSLVLGAVAANIAGLLSDGSNTRNLLLAANGLRSIGAILLFAALAGQVYVVTALVTFAAIRTLGNAIIVTAGAVAFQQTFDEDIRTKRIAEVGIIRQAGIAIGTGLTGLLIAWQGVAVTAFILAVVTLTQTPLILAFTNKDDIASAERACTSPRALLQRWIRGFDYLRRNRSVLFALIILSATFSVAQLTNVLVPVFVKNDLSSAASVYGALEMAWAIGGALVLLVARLFLPAHPHLNLALICLALTGIAMAIFALERRIWALVLMYGVLGGLFCLTRLISDSRILIETETEVVGRVRAINLLLTNGIGITIFALPFVVSTERVTGIYIAWGVTLLLLSLIIAYVKTSIELRTRVNTISSKDTS
ncbi:MAG: MFS transporter [Pseudomonadota bacterium]